MYTLEQIQSKIKDCKQDIRVLNEWKVFYEFNNDYLNMLITEKELKEVISELRFFQVMEWQSEKNSSRYIQCLNEINGKE